MYNFFQTTLHLYTASIGDTDRCPYTEFQGLTGFYKLKDKSNGFLKSVKHDTYNDDNCKVECNNEKECQSVTYCDRVINGKKIMARGICLLMNKKITTSKATKKRAGCRTYNRNNCNEGNSFSINI